MDVKETFKDFINTYLKSLFKERGYKKKALNFHKYTDDLYYIVNLQKSHGNSYYELSFYVNCGIYSSAIDECIGNDVKAFAKEADCQWRTRIQSITPIGQSRYTINRDTDVATMGLVLQTAMEEALNKMESITSTAQLVDILCKSRESYFVDIRGMLRYCIRQNLKEQAEALIQGNYDRFGQEDRWERIRNLFLNVLQEENCDWNFNILSNS